MARFDEARLQRLGGVDRQAVRDALTAAFPSRGRLEVLLDRLDRRLTDYASEASPLPEVVFHVVQSALAEGWLARLLEEAVLMVPGNRSLAGLGNGQPADGEPTSGRLATEGARAVAAPTDREVISELADVFSDQLRAGIVVERAGLRRGRQPSWHAGNAELFWSEVHRLYKGGAVLGGWPKLLREAHLERPANPVIAAAAAAAGVPIAAGIPIAGAATTVSSPEDAHAAVGTVGATRTGAASATPTGPAGGWDFFISYTGADQQWAEWIAWQLEAAGYSVYVQAWDFVPGANWMNMMTRGIEHSQRTIAVLSYPYLNSVWGRAEWQAALRRDPDGFRRKVIPVRVENCPRPELLETVVSVDLFDLTEDQTTDRLLAGVEASLSGRRKKPEQAPPFPSF
ncbi:toll/interleukin-1 receptor domain-containing protein [Parafrankia sp. EUN1f]|uniref:toll/interleukin-1 receptor domain-containing protein n=1 Tax=Parafrankia sp. EUN1f TaxID=102897 RepID=UPI0001C43D44|nr:toll/interleukin-1 receptor domain-containing protein [Parafrankia sp. EUN1f]EFC86650.1 TIR protein [Parafrankia sp. EUN1f]